MVDDMEKELDLEEQLKKLTTDDTFSHVKQQQSSQNDDGGGGGDGGTGTVGSRMSTSSHSLSLSAEKINTNTSSAVADLAPPPKPPLTLSTSSTSINSNSEVSLGKSIQENKSSPLGQNRNHVNVKKTSPKAAAQSEQAQVLSESEEKATTQFLEIVNGARMERGICPLSWNAGVKFLMARKFNVRRAMELYQQHHTARLEEGLINLDPSVEPLKSELLSGKFTVLPTRDLGGAAIAVFTARLHIPSSIPHEHTLQGLVYQLDAALEDPLTQRSGLVFIYDMSDSKYSHFDYDLSIKILTLLKGGYPARLKKVLIVTAPLWFRAPFRILRLFVREKLRDRVFTVSVPQLRVHIPNLALPRSLGGQLDINHLAWLTSCAEILSSTPDLWGITADEPLRAMASSSSSNSKENLNAVTGDVDAPSNGHSNVISKKQRRNGQSTPSPLPNSSGSSGFSDDDSLPFEERTGLSVLEFVEHLKQKGRRGLLEEYAEIISKNPEGTFNISKQRGNVSKNRYSDVLCFDHTRVVLSSTEGDSNDSSDYINANYVDGYKQKNAFISTQGPLPRTFGDFWRMIWEQVVVVIVMTTRVVERGRTKCGQYWPPDKSTSVCHEGFRLENKDVETFPDYAITRLRLCNLKTEEERNVTHLQFLSWPDYGVPSSAAAMLNFLQIMRQEQISGVTELGLKWDGNALGPPIIVHCSAGIGRTGTLCTMDVCVKRIEDQGKVDVQGTVERIRSQRAYSIQVPEQYLFCHQGCLMYARGKDLLTDLQMEGLPDLLQEGDSDSE